MNIDDIIDQYVGRSIGAKVVLSDSFRIDSDYGAEFGSGVE